MITKKSKNKPEDLNPQTIALVEAILFIKGDEGVSISTFENMIDYERPSTIKGAIEYLANKYGNDESSAFAIQEYAHDKYRLHTKSILFSKLETMPVLATTNRLSMTTIEVLTIVAYQGPITKAEIDKVRQLDSSYQVAKLKDLRLIEATGRKSETRANLYEVTDNFYKIFNIQDLATDLPPVDRYQINNESIKANQNGADSINHTNGYEEGTVNQLFKNVDETFSGNLGE